MTGPVHSGKTTLLKESIPILQKNRTLTGYLSLSIWEGDSLLGYDMYDIQEGTRHPFIRRTGEEEWEQIGSFYFIPKTLESARNRILQPPKTGGELELRIIDEVGPLELKEQGIWPALSQIILQRDFDLLLVVRETRLTSMFDLIKIKPETASVLRMGDSHIRTRLLEGLEDA